MQVISTESPDKIYVALSNVMQKVSLYEEEDDPGHAIVLQCNTKGQY